MEKEYKLIERSFKEDLRTDLLMKIRAYDKKGGKYSDEITSYMKDNKLKDYFDFNEYQLKMLLRSLDNL